MKVSKEVPKILKERKGLIQITVDPEIKKRFTAVIREIDPLMSVAGALKRLMLHTIKENNLPGYAKRPIPEGEQEIIENELASYAAPAKKGIDIK